MVDAVYSNFDVRLTPASEGVYQVRVFDAPAGSAIGEFQPPFSAAELPGLMAQLGADARYAPALVTPAPGAAPLTEPFDVAKVLGGGLFKALFRDDIGMCLQRSVDITTQRGERLRLRLRLSEVPELNNQPWEYLYDEQRSSFLCLSDVLSVVRYPDQVDSVPPLAVAPPLRILVMIARAAGTAVLEVDEEWRALQTALANLLASGQVELQQCAASLPALLREVTQHKPHVFHFIGHGTFDAERGGQLLLEDAEGEAQPTSPDELGALLVGRDPVRLVLLNSCQSGRTSTDRVLAGAAERLVKMGVPAALGMQVDVTDPAATAFSEQFYAAVAEAESVDAAVTAGRKAIMAASRGAEWGTPVVYLRAADARLFDIRAEDEATRRAKRAAELDSKAAMAHVAGRWDEELDHLTALLAIASSTPGLGQRIEAARRESELVKLYAQGMEHYNAHRGREAVDSFKRIQELAPNNPKYRGLVGFIATAQSWFVEAPRTVPAEAVPRDQRPEHYVTMLRKLIEGRLVIVLGGGVNLYGRPPGERWQDGQIQYLPTSDELAEYLAEDVLRQKQLADSTLVTVSQYVATVQGPGALRDEAHRVFDADYQPTELHRLLATLPGTLRDKGYRVGYPVIVVTNYDDVLERCLQAASEPFDLLTYATDSMPAGRFIHRPASGEPKLITLANQYKDLDVNSRVTLLKVNGAVDRQDSSGDSFVLAEDDYIDYASGADISQLIPATLLSKLRKSHLLFIGFSPSFWSLRVFLRRIWREQKFDEWVSWAVGSVDRQFDQRFWQRKNVTILDGSLESFVAGLATELENMPRVSTQS